MQLHVKGIIHLKCPIAISRSFALSKAQKSAMENGYRKEVLTQLINVEYPGALININELTVLIIQ